MDARQLRTGNLVLNSGIEEEVFNICEDEINVVGTPMSQVEPIPLTEKWLDRFGFERVRFYFQRVRFYFEKEGIQVLNRNGCWKILIDGNVITDHVKYVHSLQNLYYALTAEELEIKK